MTSPNADTPKEQLRRHVRQILASLPDNRVATDSRICSQLESLADSTTADSLAAFMAIRGEPDTTPFLTRWLASGRRLFLPRYMTGTGSYELVPVRNLTADLVPGRYNILEPNPTIPGIYPPFTASLISLWLVPALAFDRSGNRLGRGKGFYDRLLAHADGVKVGVAYDCQLVDAIPSEPHDMRMNRIVTESHIVTCDWQ